MGFKIRGLKRLQRKIRNLQQMERLDGEIKAAATHVMGEVKRYPPATEANMPRTEVIGDSVRVLPWYERGYGVRYIGGGGRPVSEDLLHRWTVRSFDGGRKAVISNNASYAVFVHSEEKQARFHGRRGWKTDKRVLDENRDFIMDRVGVAIRRELSE